VTTFRKHFARNARRTLALTAGTCAAIGLVVAFAPDTATTEPVAPRPAATGSADQLLDDHDCWSGEAPADMVGVVPGHVVVTLPGEDTPTYGAADLTSDALQQLFDGVDHGLQVWGFCR